MIFNYIRSSFRSINRNRLHGFLNILGLSVCMAVMILSILYVKEETSYDKWFDRSEDIYRIGQTFNMGDKNEEMIITSQPLARSLMAEVPEVEYATRTNNLFSGSGLVLNVNNNKIHINTYSVVDDNFFNVFSFPFKYGNRDAALIKPYTLVISEDLSKRLFGDINSAGKTIKVNGDREYTIDGVIDENMKPAHIDFEIYMSLRSNEVNQNYWGTRNNYHTYAKLKEGSSIESFKNNINQLQWKYVLPVMSQYIPNLNKDNTKMFAQPLNDIHLKSKYMFEIQTNGNITYVYIAILLALVIIIVACINYMNLATAQSSRRAKEVGVRKVSGSNKKRLISQFITESVVQSFIALVLGFIIAELTLPFFNGILGKQLSIVGNGFLTIIAISIITSLFIGFIAGLVPAIILSHFEPVKVLKGSFSTSKKGGTLRKILVISQFIVSAILIVSVMFIYKQIDFMHNKDLGFEPDQVISLKVRDDYLAEGKYDALMQEMRKNSNISGISVTSNMPGQTMGQNAFEKKDGTVEAYNFIIADPNFAEVMGIKYTDGGTFRHIEEEELNKIYSSDENFENTKQEIVVNRAFVKKFNLTEPVVGTVMRIKGVRNSVIVGVVEDFHVDNFDVEIMPIAISDWGGNPRSHIVIRMNSSDIKSTINFIEKEWRKAESVYPFNYSFLDTEFAKKFKKQEEFGKLFVGATIFTIFVAMLGLFGLASFEAQQRKKEIGVRKVMGAKDGNIIKMLVIDFTKLVAIASVIGFPIAYILMNKWLSGFAYHTSMSATPFILSFIMLLTLSVITVIWQAYRAATAKPVNVLKYE